MLWAGGTHTIGGQGIGMSRCVGECHSGAQFAASKVKGKMENAAGKRFEGMEDEMSEKTSKASTEKSDQTRVLEN